MARIQGDREDSILDKADISAIGREGSTTFKTEVWTFAPTYGTIALADELESDVLRVPAGSTILSIAAARSWTARMRLDYRDVRPDMASGFGAWTALVTEGTATDNELVALRNNAEMLKRLTYDREFRLVPLAARTVDTTNGDTVKVIIEFGNI